MQKCYVDKVDEILDEINVKLVKNKKKTIKKADWHTSLSTFTPNVIKPHWINECFRKNHFESLNSMKVKTAIEEQLISLEIKKSVSLICIEK